LDKKYRLIQSNINKINPRTIGSNLFHYKSTLDFEETPDIEF